jgi:hypothetical protein
VTPEVFVENIIPLPRQHSTCTTIGIYVLAPVRHPSGTHAVSQAPHVLPVGGWGVGVGVQSPNKVGLKSKDRNSCKRTKTEDMGQN